LRHRELNTKAERMGRVVRVRPTGLFFWRLHQHRQNRLLWR
jgi:hypothetical protein